MSAVIRSAAVGAGSTGRPASTAEVADRWSRLVDHSWLLLDDVLFCVAGSRHTDRQVTGCAYWISTRRAEQLHHQLYLPRRRPAPGAPLPALLHYAGTTYVKLPTLAPPPAWPAVHAALADAGVRPVESSLLATAELAAARGMLDPRDAVQAAAALPGHSHRCGLAVLHTLLAAIGDPAGTAGSIGLTGRRVRPGPALRRRRRGPAHLRPRRPSRGAGAGRSWSTPGSGNSAASTWPTCRRTTPGGPPTAGPGCFLRVAPGRTVTGCGPAGATSPGSATSGWT